MVGDTLKKAGNSSGGGFIDIEDFGNTEYGILILPCCQLMVGEDTEDFMPTLYQG